ncbi:SDR family oxidoreductase [Paraconexibacter antarcticus]|uniref:Peroxisomal trans-2-enoyl-CoA reductase n=1 Tax=Paraconexibacter antarcticus TaxID=2949664 RepID=A0ABY5DXD6_9ACTN|nr:SDR family oxidoreductase [Paraconexibacter antarcticus]UTI66214.1 SDR family oxidoreductase [Paraconexibacter antarcticus]
MADGYRSVFAPGLFDGRLMIVTGGGSGIGRCIAHELASLGAHVAITGRRIERLETVRTEIEDVGGAVSCHAFDIRDEAAVVAAIAEIIAAHGPIFGLVNNAGGQYPSPAEELSVKGWDAVIRNNLTGGFIVSREAYKQSMAEHGGSIVNIIADIWGGMPTMAHSGAARAGMLNLTETTACEWARSGVRVNAVAPGWVASSGFDTYDDAMKAELRRLRDEIPLGRYGNESEVSAAVTFLLTPGAAFISGSCIRVDGAVPNHRHTWTNVPTDRSIAFDGFPLATLPECLR